jgi:enediyne biosynthesis protein E4
MLKGNGRGEFKALSGDESGVKIYGEQRGAAVCDFDNDGRLDLAVTQNGAQTKLYRNAAAKPGVRVILEGSDKNRDAVGAQIWLEQSDKKSALQEIQSGSGYLSQNSRVKIIPPLTPAQISVRWPGGVTSSTPLPINSNNLKIKAPSAPQ